MKTEARKTTEVLHGLLKINNDRIAGYLKAAEETNEVDLKAFFTERAKESKENVLDLIREIKKTNDYMIWSRTTLSGKVYRVWMDVKAALNGKDSRSILNSCEFGEEVTQTAYRDAIASNELTTEARQLLRNQHVDLIASYDIIKNFKEGYTVAFTKTF
jgi:uncharacterized protein (TIGR02284 family)